MKNTTTSLSLLLAILGGPLLAALNTSCMGPAGRSQVRQETRVQNRVEHRQDRRRGW
jgi:hypothetical protein